MYKRQVQVVAKGAPLLAAGGVGRQAGSHLDHRATLSQWCTADAALAHDLGRHALVHLALGTAVDHQREVGMRVQVDETGCHRQAGDVQALPRDGRAQVAKGRHPAIAHAHILLQGGVALAVEDRAAAEDGVEHEGVPDYLPRPKTRLGSHTTSSGKATTKTMPTM